ncbi:GNAT family N-acetyltransferase [Pseudoneobacillus sp. C159]
MPNNYTIRPSNPTDIEFLWDMLYHAIHVPEGHKPPSRDVLNDPSIKRSLIDWGRTGDYALIATDPSNQPVGAVWWRLFNETTKTYGYIDEQTPILAIALLPGNRGKGIGTLLLEEIFKNAKEQGYKKISLSVDPTNPALRLYERFGFQQVGINGTSWDMVALVE